MFGIPSPQGDDPVAALRDLSRQWATIADRAFASGMSDPAAYARTLRFVTAAVEELRTRGNGATDLLSAWAGHRDLVHAVADSDPRYSLEGLDPEALAGAAFAMRYRELAETIAGARRLETLAALDDIGWVVAEESGPPEGDPFVPYRRLEIDRTRGLALAVSTYANDDFTATVHRVEQLRFDGADGTLAPIDAEDPGSTAREFATADERERHVTELRGAPPSPN